MNKLRFLKIADYPRTVDCGGACVDTIKSELFVRVSNPILLGSVAEPSR